jgi:hypothetical protein
LFDHVGMFGQATYSDPERGFSWDNVDIRYADSTRLQGKEVIYGITLNNNPTVQDVWQTVPAWWFPYVSSALAPGLADATQPILANGSLAQRTVGAGAYALWNDWVYAELSGYGGLSHGAQLHLGQTGGDTADRLHGVSPYWRLAVQHEFGPHYFALGTYGLDAYRYPANNRSFGTDHITDSAIDATYQATLNGGEHIVSLYGTALRETLSLKGSSGGLAADNLHDRLLSTRINASYYYQNTWGINASRFATWGNTDAAYYGTASGKPNSAGWTVQFDVTPFGKSDSFGAPWLNARFFVQYTAYDRFNGGKRNYDGMGRNASDNNTVFAGLWFAF